MTLYFFDLKAELSRIKRQGSESGQQLSADSQQPENIDFTGCQQSKQSQQGLSEKTTYQGNEVVTKNTAEITTTGRQYIYNTKKIHTKAIQLNDIESMPYIDSLSNGQLNTGTKISKNKIPAANFANSADLHTDGTFPAANHLLTSADQYVLPDDFESSQINKHKNKVINAVNLNELYTALEGFSRYAWSLCQRADMSSAYTPIVLTLIEREHANKWCVLESLAHLCWKNSKT